MHTMSQINSIALAKDSERLQLLKVSTHVSTTKKDLFPFLFCINVYLCIHLPSSSLLGCLLLLQDVAGTNVYDDKRAESEKILLDTAAKKAQIGEVLTVIHGRLTDLEVSSHHTVHDMHLLFIIIIYLAVKAGVFSPSFVLLFCLSGISFFICHFIIY